MEISFITLLDFGLPALEEMKGVRGFRVDVLYDWENVQDVFLCESWLVAAVEVVFLNKDLQREAKAMYLLHIHETCREMSRPIKALPGCQF